MKFWVTFLILTIALDIKLYSQVRLETTEVDTATVISGLDIPWEITWGPDSMLWVTERFGRVSRINPASGEQDVILDISDIVYQSGESGLLGMALHPDFETSPYVFMSYTYHPGNSFLEKVVRYTYEGDTLINETVLLDSIQDSIQANINHDGSRLVISPDLKLFITTGDALNQQAPQDTSSLNGKVLRINLDGSIPVDNPWPGSPVWSYGHRNPQGLFFAANGILYSSEHGPSTDDEINIIEPGRNYGWPLVKGYCDQPGEIPFCEQLNIKEPIDAWTPTIAPAGIVVYTHEAIPEWQNSILLTTLKNKRLYVLHLDEDGTAIVSEEQLFIDYWGRLRDICTGPNGEVYLATNGPDSQNTQPFTHRIVKVWNPDYTLVDDPGRDSGKLPNMQIYPNPGSDIFNLQFTVYNLQSVTILLVDLTGRIIYKDNPGKLNTGEHQVPVNLSLLPKGIYFCTLKTSNGTYTRKLVKQ